MQKRQEILLKIIFGFILILVPVCFFDKITVPAVLNDEIGYLANAAFFSGYEWNTVLLDIPYYSYGYSLLISLLIKNINNSGSIYGIIIVLNGVFLAVSFIALCGCSKMLYKKENLFVRTAICFISILSASTIVYSQYAWAESCLLAVASLIIYSLLCVIKKSKNSNIAVLAVLTVGIYIIHQRTMAVVLAVVVTIVYLLVTKKIGFRQFIIFITILGVGLLLHRVVKSGLQNNLWNIGTTINNANDYSGQFSKIASLATSDGIKNFIYSLSGKTFALLVSYFLLPGVFYIFLIHKYICSWLETKKFPTDMQTIIGTYLAVALLFALGVCSVYFLVPDRADQIVYTRYYDYLMPAMVMFSLFWLRNSKCGAKVYIGIGCVLLLLAFITKKAIDVAALRQFISIQTPYIYIINEMEIDYYFVAVVLVVFFLIFHLFWSQKGEMNYALVCLIVIAISSIKVGQFALTGFRASDVITVANRICIQELADFIDDNIDLEEKIYLLQDEDYMQHYYGGVLQSQTKEYEYEYITSEKELNSIVKENDIYMVLWKNNFKNLGIKESQIKFKNENFYLLYITE